MINAGQADLYTNFDGLAKLKTEARKDSPEALKQTAKQFEAVFINNVLKAMREAKLSDGILDSDESKFFTEMYHQQLSGTLSGSLGLSDLIVKQLGGKVESNNSAKLDLEDYANATSSSNAQAYVGQPGYANARVASSVASQGNSDEAALEALFNEPITQDANKAIQSPQDFVQRLRPYAQQAAKELGVEPGVLLAQAALETGWGQSLIKNSNGSNSFNLFNIKADKAWQGRQAQVPTLEYEGGVVKKVNAGFRSYSSFKESFKDYVSFIKSNPRYENALRQAGNPKQYVQELQKAGYATDPKYADKVLDIYKGDTLAGSQAKAQVASNG
ncbi:MAG: flagellar assembly peptidoglycan hydrolase FlgJ [Methylococcaceae bacterium]|jgi:flagellar protein FlgJ